MIVVFAGVDKCGKSTLISELSKKNGWPVIYKGKRVSIPDALMLTQRVLDQDSGGVNLVDRLHYPDELVYGPVIENRFPCPRERRIFETLVAQLARKGIIIYCTASLEFLYERFARDPDEWVKKENLPRLLETYEEVLNASPVLVTRVDTEERLESQIKKVECAVEIGGGLLSCKPPLSLQ